MNNSRFSVSVHILTLLARAEGEYLSSEYLAGSININPVMVRKELLNLKKFGLVDSREGKSGGSSLAKPAAEIRLSDVYQATRQADLLGRSKNKPNPHCPVGKKMDSRLDGIYLDAEKALLQQLGKTNLKKFAHAFD